MGLEFRLSVPETDARPPLIVLVHGRAGDEKVMWLFSRALPRSRALVVSPRAPIVDPIGGYSWWLLESSALAVDPDRRKTTEAQLTPAVNQLRAFIKKIVKQYNADESRIIGLGFSQGGAVLGSLALTDPQLFMGIGMLCSFVPSVALTTEPQPSETKFFVAHGLQDDIVSYEHASRSVDRLRSRGFRVDFHVDDVGHKMGAAGVKALERWIQQVLDGSL
jgi:phospholipase/carboxylesterase